MDSDGHIRVLREEADTCRSVGQFLLTIWAVVFLGKIWQVCNRNRVYMLKGERTGEKGCGVRVSLSTLHRVSIEPYVDSIGTGHAASLFRRIIQKKTI